MYLKIENIWKKNLVIEQTIYWDQLYTRLLNLVYIGLIVPL